MVQVRISVDNSESACSLLSFPQGVPEENLNITIGEKGTGQKRKRMVIGDLNGTCFQGVNFPKKDSLQYAIGLLDDKNGEMRIIPVDHAYVMRVQGKADTVQHIAALEYNQRRESLIENFGSKKKKKSQKALKSNIISAENIAGVDAIETAISSTMEDIDESDRNVFVDGVKEALEKNRQALLPKFNLTASKIENIYPLDGMIPPTIMSALIDEFKAMKPGVTTDNNEDEEEDAFDGSAFTCELKFQTLHAPSFIICMLSKVRNASAYELPATITKEKCYGVLVYLTYLMRLYTMISSNRDMKVTDIALHKERWQPSLEVRKFIVKQFCGRSGKAVLQSSKEQMDRLLLVVLVLLLTLGGFTLSIGPLAEDLKMSPAPLSLLCKELGCKVEKRPVVVDEEGNREGNSLTATLVFPLKFPEPRRAKALKKK